MAITQSTYYGFTRIREMSPDAQDWAVVDLNWDIVSKVIKTFEAHHHTGASGISYPGFNGASGIPHSLTASAGGVLPPSATPGVRLSYIDSLGLETDANPEVTLASVATASPPITPAINSVQAASPGLGGGTYVYAITKKKGTGETLPSPLATVNVSYDTTYSVTLGFDAINTYSDGTTALNIYRAAGLNQPMQLVTTITVTSTATFVDTGSIPSQNTNIQPPTVSTFDAVRKVRISWASMTHPAAAKYIRVYVTQTGGMWSTSHLLSQVDISGGSPPTYIDYLGSENLASGWPKEVSQIASSPPKLNLGTEASGAPILTANMDFAGYQAQNMVLHNTTTAHATNGAMWYDTSTTSIKARVNGSVVTIGSASAASGSYTHPAEDAGGHIAANIKHAAGSSVTVKNIFDWFANSSTGARVQATLSGTVSGTTSSPTMTSSTPAVMPEMTQTGPVRQFTSQKVVVHFSGTLKGDTQGMTVSWGIEVNGALVTSRSMGVAYANQIFPAHSSIHYTASGDSHTIRVLWWVDTGIATAVSTNRNFYWQALL